MRKLCILAAAMVAPTVAMGDFLEIEYWGTVQQRDGVDTPAIGSSFYDKFTIDFTNVGAPSIGGAGASWETIGGPSFIRTPTGATGDSSRDFMSALRSPTGDVFTVRDAEYWENGSVVRLLDFSSPSWMEDDYDMSPGFFGDVWNAVLKVTQRAGSVLQSWSGIVSGVRIRLYEGAPGVCRR